MVKSKARALREPATLAATLSLLWTRSLGRVQPLGWAQALGRMPVIGRARVWMVSPVAAGLLVAVLATPFAIGEGGRAAVAAVAAAAVQDPLALLAQRSPGERAAGAMHSTKPTRVASAPRTAPVVPKERVLSSVRERAPESPAEAVPEIGMPVIDAPIEVAEAAPSAPPVPFIAPPFFGPPSIVIPGPGPNPGPGPGPGPDPEPPTPPTPAIPEPATWAMLLGGFFAIGAVLRRRERQPAAYPVLQPLAR